MGLVFKTEEERNPTNQAPAPSVMSECDKIKEERDLMNQFLEELGHAVTYDLWLSAKEEVKKMQQSYEQNGGFEEVQ